MGFEENIDQALAKDSKPWWRSKIILVNLAALALAAAEANLAALQGHIPGGLMAWLMFLLPPINIFLRFITRAGVRW